MPRFDTTTLRGASIYIDAGAHLATRFAADELQRYLQTMTGRRLPVVPDASLAGRTALVLGSALEETVVPPLTDPGSFRINPGVACVTLEGGSPRTLLSAVYALLEQLGCRWSLHGPSEEMVPPIKNAIEIRDLQRSPCFAVSGYASDIMTWHYTQPEYFNDRLAEDRAFIDWMGKSGANTFLFIRHPFDTQLTIPELLPEFQRRGIGVEYGGHVIPLLLPRELHRQHPEYFPATADGTRSDHGNLCTSNAAALATASANAVQYVRDYPEMSAIHIWGADLWQGGWCCCSACGAVGVQDQSLRVCNAVARGLAEAGVMRPVCYLAYHDTIEPTLTLPPDDNVIVEFAPRERCYGHALNDPACDTNRRYASALERYVDRFDGRVRLFEYYGDAILFFGCAVPLTGVITADMEYFRQLGVPGITMLQFGTYSLWAHPLNFLTFAAAAYAQSAALCESYCARFGQSAPGALETFTALERAMRRVVTYGDIRRPPRAPAVAGQVLQRVEAALPALQDVAERLEKLGGEGLAAQATLVRYSRTVLEGVREELQTTLAGRRLGTSERYAEALRIVDAVERRFKGLWGSVDLPIIHSFYTAAAHAE